MVQVQFQRMTQTQSKTISHIFPEVPPVVKVHPLPKKAEFFTYSINDHLTISAWMPDGVETINQQRNYSNDSFYDRYCSDCERNCHDFLAANLDDDGEVCWEYIPGGENNHCFVYEEGFYGQSCPEGYEAIKEDINLIVANMVFSIKLTYMNERQGRFEKAGDSAYLCAGYCENGEVFTTKTLMASNVFGDSEYPESICWGSNERPNTLREIVTGYFSTPFNNDLVPLSAFEDNSDELRNLVKSEGFSYDPDHTYICLGEEADTLLLLDAEKDITSFFTMLCAGFKPLEEASHIMIIPAKEATIEKNGGHYRGYQTIPDDVGKSWFVTEDGLLVGQI